MGTRSFFRFPRLPRAWRATDEWADAAGDSDLGTRVNTAVDATRAAPAAGAGCRHCARLRWFVGGSLLAAGLVILHAAAQAPAGGSASDATHYVATPRPLPERPERPRTATAVPDAPAPAVTASAPARDDLMWLVYQTVPLPNARLHQPYKARDVVRGGRAPYRFSVDGALPPGMFLEEDGVLAGTPTATGTFRFLLTVRDASRPPHLDQAMYVLRVVDPKPATATPAAPPATKPAAAAARPAKSRPDNTLKSVTEDQTNLTVPRDPPLPMTYVLTAAKLETIFKNAEASMGESLMTAANAANAADGTAVGNEASAPRPLAVKPPVLGPTLDQLREMLTPLQDVEHPTRAVFQDSLRARQCEYFLRHVNALALEQHKDAIRRCPRREDLAETDRPHLAASGSAATVKATKAAKPTTPTAPTSALAPGSLPVMTFLDMLMPPHLLEEITDVAGTEHPLSQARPLRLKPDGCGCSLQDIENDVFGFMPYWMGGETDAPIPVRFDKFTRLQYMGVLLRNNGEYLRPTGWDSPGGGFARRVDQHGVGLDLVLYRRDFRALMRLTDEERKTVLDTTAAQIGEMLDLRHGDLQGGLETLLPPGWREEAHVYDGLTVFFEPTDDEAADPRFEQFLLAYLHRLTETMQARGTRAFHLNLVIPQHLLGETSTAFRFRNLLAIMKAAERQRGVGDDSGRKERSAAAVTYKSSPDYVGTSDITVSFLAPLGTGSDIGKMQLRSRTDFNDELAGQDRMAVLGSVVPVLLHPGGKPEALAPEEQESLDRDLVYIGWSFGGVALWPLPVAGLGAGESVLTALDHRFWSFLDQDTGFCRIVCPMRMPLRLALEALMVLVGTALLVYGWNCRVRRMGRVILMGLWAGAIATLAVAFAIFSCDPSLNELRKGNTLLVAIILILVVGGLVVTFKPRVEPP
ncbi:hypothetical protein [Roseateles sp.]|uniref:hypothetical protein n=1 Tax=Roseateles sp. TaxID=1971397 RepID=UPI0031D94B3D